MKLKAGEFEIHVPSHYTLIWNSSFRTLLYSTYCTEYISRPQVFLVWRMSPKYGVAPWVSDEHGQPLSDRIFPLVLSMLLLRHCRVIYLDLSDVSSLHIDAI